MVACSAVKGWHGVTLPCTQVAVRLSGWRWRGTDPRSTHRKVEGKAVAQAVAALLKGLREEESVLLEALVPTGRLPTLPPRKTPLGYPPLRKGFWGLPRVCLWVGGGHLGLSP